MSIKRVIEFTEDEIRGYLAKRHTLATLGEARIMAADGSVLLQLDEARSLELASRKDPRMTVLLESLRTNLFRKWSDT